MGCMFEILNFATIWLLTANKIGETEHAFHQIYVQYLHCIDSIAMQFKDASGIFKVQ